MARSLRGNAARRDPSVDPEYLALQAMSASDILKDKKRQLMLAEELLLDAKEARGDVFKFFDFVMLEETSKERLTIAPHQKIGLSFIMEHEFSVNMWPIGHSKTYSVAALTLFLFGQDATTRGAIVSAAQMQASKPLAMVRDYIESNARLHLVFPHLRPSLREGDKWTQTAITIDRPVGIRDPSLVAVGFEGALAGARLNWIITDDLLSHENTATKEQRDKVYDWMQSIVIPRLDPKGGRLAVTNTAWHPDDLAHRLEAIGKPTLRMSATGEITIRNAHDSWGTGDDEVSNLMRPTSDSPWDITVRIARADESDNDNSQTLWPERVNKEKLEELRIENPFRFNQLYRQECRDDSTAKCKLEYIETCKRKAREMGWHSFSSVPRGPAGEQFVCVFTGLDLAVKEGEEHDDVAFFSFGVLENGLRVILDIEAGQWGGPIIVDKAILKHQTYDSIVRVETNAAQDYLRQFVLDKNVAVPIRAHTTTSRKAHPEFGIESLFIELANGAWLIPNDKNGKVDRVVQRFIDACLYYNPAKHTDDVLMACYFAREQAREFGVLSGGHTAKLGDNGPGIATAISAR